MCPTRLEPRVAESEFYFQTALPSHAPASPPAGVQAWPSGARGPSSVQLAMRTLPHPHLLPSQQVPASCPTSPVATGFPPAGSAASEPGPSVYTSSFLPASRQAVHTPRSQASEILLVQVLTPGPRFLCGKATHTQKANFAPPLSNPSWSKSWEVGHSLERAHHFG